MPRIPGRHIRELTLLSAIIVGGLLAPASHLVYMHLSDFHSTEMQHVNPGNTSFDAPATTDFSVASRVNAPKDARYECPYLVLFATSLVAESIGDDTEIHEPDPVELRHTITEAPCTAVSFTSYGVRGPPQVEMVT